MACKVVIGIDFGTTKSLVAYLPLSAPDDARPRFATFTEEAGLTPGENDAPFQRFGVGTNVQPVPSVIAVDAASEDSSRPRLIPGFRALLRDQKGSEHFRLVRDLKERTAAGKERRLVTVGANQYPVEGLLGHFFAALWKNTELSSRFSCPAGVTITVPAKSGTVQRMTTRFAASVAGFQEGIEVLEEPVAAFLYHRHLKADRFRTKRNESKFTLVVDFGGGTCDLVVIKYEQEQLPYVVGRAMARFGGERIDQLFLETFWLNDYRSNNKPEAESPLMDQSRFEQADWTVQALLLAYARMAKELLSSARPHSHAADVTGAIPYYPDDPESLGLMVAPRVYLQDFSAMLREKTFGAFYPGSRDFKTFSVKGHLEELLTMVLEDSQLNRSDISNVVLAGGSIRLPSVRKWIIDYLGAPGYGSSKADRRRLDVHDQDPELSIAGGAAIHQFYANHKKRKWRRVVEPTLSSDIWLVHFRDKKGYEDKIQLAAAHEVLPKDCLGYRAAAVIPKPKPWPDGRFRIVIRDAEWETVYDLPEEFLTGKGIRRYAQAILVPFYIDEFGTLQQIQLVAGTIFTGWRLGKKIEKYGVLDEQMISVDIKDLQLTNTRRITHLRERFIPEGLQVRGGQ